MSERFRVGRKVGRTIYDGDTLVGVMDTADLARFVVAGMNNDYLQSLESNNEKLEARIQSLEAELKYHKSHHTARYVVDVCNRNDELTAKVAALTEVLKQAQEALIVAKGQACPDYAKCAHKTCRIQREISKALGA